MPQLNALEVDTGQLADADKFETILARYLAGEIEEDAFGLVTPWRLWV